MKRTLLAVALLVSANANAFLICNNNTTGQSVQWFVGQPVPSLDTTGDVVCAAQGAELQYIRANFNSIPMRTGSTRTVLFRGDTAVFILDNL